MPKKTVTLTAPMSATLATYADIWNVSECEVLRRLFAMGAYVAGELEGGTKIFARQKEDFAPVELRFPGFQGR